MKPLVPWLLLLPLLPVHFRTGIMMVSFMIKITALQFATHNSWMQMVTSWGTHVIPRLGVDKMDSLPVSKSVFQLRLQ